MLETPKFLNMAIHSKHLISGGEGGKPDWGKFGQRTRYVDHNPLSIVPLTLRLADQLERSNLRHVLFTILQQNLNKSKNISARLDGYIDIGPRSSRTSSKIAGSVGASDTALDGQKEPTKQLIQDSKCSIRLQYTSPATGSCSQRHCDAAAPSNTSTALRLV